MIFFKKIFEQVIYGKSGYVRDGLQRRGEGGLLHTVLRAGDAKVSEWIRKRERERERERDWRKNDFKTPHGRSAGSLFWSQLASYSIPICLPSCSSPMQELTKNWTSARACCYPSGAWRGEGGTLPLHARRPVIEADQERILFLNGDCAQSSFFWTTSILSNNFYWTSAIPFQAAPPVRLRVQPCLPGGGRVEGEDHGRVPTDVQGRVRRQGPGTVI